MAKEEKSRVSPGEKLSAAGAPSFALAEKTIDVLISSSSAIGSLLPPSVVLNSFRRAQRKKKKKWFYIHTLTKIPVDCIYTAGEAVN